MRRRMIVAVVVMALLAGFVVSGVAGWQWWHHKAPYGPEVIVARASLEFVSYEAAQMALGPGVNAPYPDQQDQLVLGRVSWQAPPVPLAGGSYMLILIDKQTERKPEVLSVSATRPDGVGVGTDGALQAAADLYPWLKGAGFQRVGDDFVSAGNAVYVYEADASPVTLVALFPAVDGPLAPMFQSATAHVDLADLLLALVFVGPDHQVFWAQRLVG